MWVFVLGAWASCRMENDKLIKRNQGLRSANERLEGEKEGLRKELERTRKKFLQLEDTCKALQQQNLTLRQHQHQHQHQQQQKSSRPPPAAGAPPQRPEKMARTTAPDGRGKGQPLAPAKAAGAGHGADHGVRPKPLKSFMGRPAPREGCDMGDERKRAVKFPASVPTSLKR
jgi:TolA-binding protein